MDNDTKINKKGSIMKPLAIIGFIAIIIIISWFSIRLVNVLPSAFSSLASLAEGLTQQTFKDKNNAEEQQTFVVTSNTTIINSGETIDVYWGKARAQGTYTFNYSCTSGVSINLLNTENGSTVIACDTNYDLGNTDSVTITVESEKKRFENIFYTVSFISANENISKASGNASFTVINSSIDEFTETETTEDEELEETETTEDEELEETETTEETPVVTQPEPKPEPPAVTNPPAPTYEQEFIYEIPTSNPNGRTDLSTRFLSTGNITGRTYIQGMIEKNDTGAIQFEVKNLGSKTSDEWTYSVSLPAGGVYTSTDQEPLKPNERAVITVGFPTDDTSQFTFVVRINEPSDQATLNNQFSKVVYFVR